MRRFGLAGLVLCAMLVPLAPSISRASGGPVVDAVAFRGQGHLAFLCAHTLYILDGDTGTVRHPAGSTPVVQMAWSPSGHSVLLVTGTGREVWHDKALMICDVIAPRCRTLPRQPGAVAIDPAWSPHANRIAFVQARDRASAGAFGFTTTQALMAWMQTRTLWIADGRGAHAHQIAAAGTGVYQPRWAADGRHILYIRDDALWLIDAAGGPPARIMGPFPGKPDLFGFYGHAWWPITVAWSRR